MAIVLLSTPLLVACGGDSDSDAGGQFVGATRADYPLPCLEHQPETPGTAYTGGAEGGNTSAILAVLEYYTANKAVTAYCDGKPPTDKDRTWAQLYVDLGAERSNVAHLLG
ncbi:MAG: hypothetical protein ACT4P1_13325 [Sporichthyaceae bacterium]